MKTIGILGGMSWHSTELYYKLINEGVQQKLGGLHSASILMASVDFADMEELQRNNEWEKASQILANLALKLQQAGADCIVIATNTMHISVPLIEQSISIPLLHIADATADAILNRGYTTTGLLGTRFTMQMDYYRERLINKGIRVLIPDESGCQQVNDIIYNELCYGDIREHSRQAYLQIIDDLHSKGAECIIEGCTEITLLVKQEDTPVKLFDTTAIHAQAAVGFALQDDY